MKKLHICLLATVVGCSSHTRNAVENDENGGGAEGMVVTIKPSKTTGGSVSTGGQDGESGGSVANPPMTGGQTGGGGTTPTGGSGGTGTGGTGGNGTGGIVSTGGNGVGGTGGNGTGGEDPVDCNTGRIACDHFHSMAWVEEGQAFYPNVPYPNREEPWTVEIGTCGPPNLPLIPGFYSQNSPSGRLVYADGDTVCLNRGDRKMPPERVFVIGKYGYSSAGPVPKPVYHHETGGNCRFLDDILTQNQSGWDYYWPESEASNPEDYQIERCP